MEEENLQVVTKAWDILLDMQKKFQKDYGFEFWKLDPDRRRDMFVRALFAAMSELGEAGDEVNRWWKKGCREPEALVIRKEAILEEMIDSLHFFLTALLTMGATGGDIAKCYRDKLDINFKRQQDKSLGYV